MSRVIVVIYNRYNEFGEHDEFFNRNKLIQFKARTRSELYFHSQLMLFGIIYTYNFCIFFFVAPDEILYLLYVTITNLIVV